MPRRRSAPVRSQALLDAGLTMLAIVAALLLLRLLFRLIAIPGRVWSGETLYAITDPLVLPLALLPGGDRVMFGSATLADMTAAALILIVPAFWLSRPRRA
jgi:hypothetical protein